MNAPALVISRPPPPFVLTRPGQRWEVEPDTGWSTKPEDVDGLVCRRYQGHDMGHAGTPAVAVLFRRRYARTPPYTRSARWGYCAEHLYGRWIEREIVVGWVVRGGRL